MAQARSLSLSKFTAAVQTAVNAAVEKHPKFKMDAPTKLSLGYLIRGIPVPEQIATHATNAETRAFANEVAKQLASGPDAAGLHIPRSEGAIFDHGILIVGIPVPEELLFER